MAAHDHLGSQWDDFFSSKPDSAPAEAIHQWATPLDWDRREHPDVADFWEEKTDEASMRGMDDSIQQHGVVNPVRMYDVGLLRDGHHRIAAAMKVNPQADVPIFWINNPDEQPEYKEKGPDGRWLPDVNNGF